jgi:hypothetical protein
MSWDELSLLDEQAIEHKEFINVTELNRSEKLKNV